MEAKDQTKRRTYIKAIHLTVSEETNRKITGGGDFRFGVKNLEKKMALDLGFLDTGVGVFSLVKKQIKRFLFVVRKKQGSM